MAKDVKPATESVKISVKEIDDMLTRGYKRRDIAAHYKVPIATIKEVFDKTPALKGRRSRPTVPYEILNDLETEGQETATETKVDAPAPTVAETPAPSPAAEQPTSQPEAAPVAAGTGNAAGMW